MLIAADVGLAMPRGADLARATTDLVLLDKHLQTLLAARILSTRTDGFQPMAGPVKQHPGSRFFSTRLAARRRYAVTGYF